MKLSFIIPVYKVESYLRKCVDSLLMQDYDDYEIILVDDGSPDGCPQICDEYASRLSPLAPRLRVIHQPNAGLSAARNSGIAIAQGEYICFVDSDDYWEPNVLGTLMAQIERDNLDVLRFNYQNINESGNIFHPFKSEKPFSDYSSDVVDGEVFLNERLGYACYAWAFILRKDLLNGCLFKPGIYFEDTDWTPRMLLKAKRVASTDKIVYNYLWREGSITLPDTPAKKKKVLEDKILLLDGFKKHQELAQDKRWFKWQLAAATMSILGILSTYSSSERKPYIEELESKGLFPLPLYRATGNNKHKRRLANISPSMYCRLMHTKYAFGRKQLFVMLNILRLWPHMLLYALSKNRRLIQQDVEAYRREYKRGNLLWFLTYNRSFRGLFYYRIRVRKNLLQWLAPTVSELTIPPTVKIDGGLLLFHSYSTILNAKKIGTNCRILHLVTLGDKRGGVPTIGNNVVILPGAVVVGGITIGDNCVIGPNAVVFKSVPANCVVVGNPAYILKRDGVVVNEKL